MEAAENNPNARQLWAETEMVWVLGGRLPLQP